MKKVILVFIASLLMINYSCKEKIDAEKEKKVILTVIEEETASYYASDFARWSATYLNDSTNIAMFEYKSGYNIYSGWESLSSMMKPTIMGKKEAQKEVKTPIQIKIYGESAWVVYDNESFNNKGESTGKATATNFLEKHDGKWKIVYRNVIQDDSYYQADYFVINSINYAKSIGKKVEDIASFTGDQFKTGWNKSAGYSGFVNGTLDNWRSVIPRGGIKIMEQDSSHIIFSANKMFPELKKNGSQFNVTYDEYLAFYRIVFEKFADYLGAIYKQETKPDGVLVTITKK
jgi:hypothetical protein